MWMAAERAVHRLFDFYRTMKRATHVVLILPLVLFAIFWGIAKAFSLPSGLFQLLLPVFAALWFFSSLACLVRGTWILKSPRQFFISLAILYLLFLAIILNILFVAT
jgi:hypothetical protein